MHACVRMCWTHSEVIPVASVLGGFSCKHFHVPRFRWLRLYRRRGGVPTVGGTRCPACTTDLPEFALPAARPARGMARVEIAEVRHAPGLRGRAGDHVGRGEILEFFHARRGHRPRRAAGTARAPFLRITPLNQDSTSPLQHAACRFYAPTQHRIAVRSAPLADIYAHCGHNRPNDKSVQATAVPKTREASSYQRFTPLMHELRHESYTIVLPEVVCHVGCAWSICLRSCRPCYP